MNIIVTGATSFIGLSLTKALLKRGDIVYAVIRKNSKKRERLPKHCCLHIIELSFDEYDSLFLYVKDPIDIVFHLTWNGTRNPERMQYDLQKENYRLSSRFIDQCIQYEVKKFIGFGSQAEYGFVEGIVNEQTICKPNTAYGIFKRKTSDYLFEQYKNTNTSAIWVRIFSIFGPGDSQDTLISFLIREMKAHHDIPLTLCTQQWDYLYIDDLITYVIQLGIQRCENGIYNLASGEHKPLMDYVEDLKILMNSNSTLMYGEKPYGKEGIVNLIPDVNKVQSMINWKPVKSFHEHIHEMLKMDEIL